MGDDLVKRLRDEKMGCNLWCEYYDGITTIPLCIEAADRIEELEAALREIASVDGVSAGTDKDMYRRWRRVATNAIDIARKVLEGKDD